MSDTIDDAAWPPQLKNAPRGRQRRRVRQARNPPYVAPANERPPASVTDLEDYRDL